MEDFNLSGTSTRLSDGYFVDYWIAREGVWDKISLDSRQDMRTTAVR